METFVTHPEFQKLNIGFALDEGIIAAFCFLCISQKFSSFKKKDMFLDWLSPQKNKSEKHLNFKSSLLI